jgi:hypothetical protein
MKKGKQMKLVFFVDCNTVKDLLAELTIEKFEKFYDINLESFEEFDVMMKEDEDSEYKTLGDDVYFKIVVKHGS